jgi:hypothetical protein
MRHKSPLPTGGGHLRVFFDKEKAIRAITRYTKRVKEELGWEVKEVESEAGLRVTGDFKLGKKYYCFSLSKDNVEQGSTYLEKLPLS